MSNQPRAIGAFLTDTDVEVVARTLYNRFYYEYGTRPQWVDNAKVRALKTAEVKRVLDALSMSGFKVVPDNQQKFPEKPKVQNGADS